VARAWCSCRECRELELEELARVGHCPARACNMETSMPGVFAAGDVRHGSVKRVASAVGEGSIAASQLYQYGFSQPPVSGVTKPVS
jgi:thioredoxin reductase